MKNRETDAAWAYHNGTKHSYQSIRADAHSLDWENQPAAFKIYTGLKPVALPQPLSSTTMPALSAISLSDVATESPAIPTRQMLEIGRAHV